MSILRKAHAALTLGFAGWLCFVLSLTIPTVQRSAIFLHWVRYPINADFARPEKYGISAGKVRNFHLTTPDGARLGVWHALPDAIYARELAKTGDGILGLNTPNISESTFASALQTHPVVLYTHGNAASRAQSFRTHMLRGLTSPRPGPGGCPDGANFVIFDYRGFADSSPASDYPPSEEGTIMDARTVWDWLVKDQGVDAERISLVGQSLGTGVAVGLAHQLATEGVKPKAVALVAGFSSVGKLLRTYKLGKFIPIMSPFAGWPRVVDYFSGFLQTRFETEAVISSVRSPLLLIHAHDDVDIHPSHSADLFAHLLASHDQASSEPCVRMLELGGYGRVATFSRAPHAAPVYHLDAQHGAHNAVGYSETALRATMALVCAPSADAAAAEVQ